MSPFFLTNVGWVDTRSNFSYANRFNSKNAKHLIGLVVDALVGLRVNQYVVFIFFYLRPLKVNDQCERIKKKRENIHGETLRVIISTREKKKKKKL